MSISKICSTPFADTDSEWINESVSVQKAIDTSECVKERARESEAGCAQSTKITEAVREALCILTSKIPLISVHALTAM